ncbi:MAG: hypothetical protein RLZZ458_394 [Planctomycetota bacterium]
MAGVDLTNDLAADVAAGRVIVLAGAGLSKNVTGNQSPDWRALLETGVRHLAGLGERDDWCAWVSGSLNTNFLRRGWGAIL